MQTYNILQIRYAIFIIYVIEKINTHRWRCCMIGIMSIVLPPTPIWRAYNSEMLKQSNSSTMSVLQLPGDTSDRARSETAIIHPLGGASDSSRLSLASENLKMCTILLVPGKVKQAAYLSILQAHVPRE